MTPDEHPSPPLLFTDNHLLLPVVSQGTILSLSSLSSKSIEEGGPIKFKVNKVWFCPVAQGTLVRVFLGTLGIYQTQTSGP